MLLPSLPPLTKKLWAAEMETAVSVFLLLCSFPRLQEALQYHTIVLVLIQEVAAADNGREHRCRHRLTSTLIKSDQILTVL